MSKSKVSASSVGLHPEKNAVENKKIKNKIINNNLRISPHVITKYVLNYTYHLEKSQF
jgi:hypothetical protein